MKSLRFQPRGTGSRFAEMLRIGGTTGEWPPPMVVPHRVDFHTVLLTREGQGHHVIDFDWHACAPGTVSWAMPDQVQRVVPDPSLSVVALLVRRDALLIAEAADRLEARPPERVSWAVGRQEQARLADFLDALSADIDAQHDELVRSRVTTLLLELERRSRLDEAPHDAESAHLLAAVRLAINERFRTTRRVEDYAAVLGYSARTLNRACQRLTGKTVKALLLERTMLEARRLLVDSSATVASIATELGFSEPTNFVSAFRREVGVTPQRFRSDLVARGVPLGGRGPAGPPRGNV
ncbi:Transcriptional regulator, AraC family [Mycetocola reblochoni REB411]|uniref:Transcriptional regulator, AraC family n=1 Tax=Mycetocola reblochoni REB411 TaxID=1255698 RepID=A0A1R4JI12_9MICO|nr:Transcriptional regulator, AraC family [Mycetocola reblochoni REB411]